MDHLQADIDSLETEKGELKNKLKHFSKKILIEVTGTGNDSNKPCQECPFLHNKLKLTKMALKHEIDQRAKLENNYCEQIFSQLKPLPVS
ncbi:unnamed protein product [Macrosiphum euphorbiae]|uniref:Uncharacterized protein n=1 Tax=Macrosiphum euphorbiae TaxID=13131 RepID=A0AAV0XH00_9HEMI|nr:unnamed protein product [Macrosiphum euphorbiae]